MRWTHLFMIAAMAMVSFELRADPIASSDELHQLVADKKYPQAMQKITAGLALKGPAAQSVDRYGLFMLKAECHLQTRAVSMAIDAYTNAAKEAEKIGDDRQRSIAAAHAALLKASKAFTYTPKSNPDKTRPVPIDILDPANRRQAFLAMLVDELAANESKLKAAKTAKSLAPIAQVIKPLSDMEGLELSAKEQSDQAEKITQVRKELVESTKKLLAEALRTMNKRIGEIDKEAGAYVEIIQDVSNPFNVLPQYRRERVWRKKGLTDAQTKELQDLTANCDKIGPALTELAAGLKTEDKTFDPFNDEASRIRKEIDRILDTDYLKTYREKPRQ